MLEDIKVLLGLTGEDKDELIELLIKQATQLAYHWTTAEEITPILKVAITKMVIYDYNRLGTEGLESESYSGASYSYKDGYPEDITTLLDAIKVTTAGTNKFRLLW